MVVVVGVISMAQTSRVLNKVSKKGKFKKNFKKIIIIIKRGVLLWGLLELGNLFQREL